MVPVLDKLFLMNGLQKRKSSAIRVAEPWEFACGVNMLPLEVELTQFEFRIWLEEEATRGLAPSSEIPIFCGCRHKTASAPKRRSGKVRSWYARPSRRRDRLDRPCPRRHQLITGHYSQLSLSHPPSDPPIRTVQFLRAFFEMPSMRRTHTLLFREVAQFTAS